MGIPNVYKDSNETSTATYDYLDLATGQGYKRYYLCQATNSVGVTFFVTPQIVDSKDIILTYTGSNAAAADRYDTDYDLTFNTPQVIKGQFLFNITTGQSAVDATKYCSMYLVINIYKVDTSNTETLLGSVTTPTRATTSAGTTYYRECVTEEISKTHFAIGEKLRINVIMNTTHSGIANTSGHYYTDPSDLGSAIGYDTNFSVMIPYKIDL